MDTTPGRSRAQPPRSRRPRRAPGPTSTRPRRQSWAAAAGLGTQEVAGALVFRWAATGRRYFSRTIGLGVVAPASRRRDRRDPRRLRASRGSRCSCCSRCRTAGRPSTSSWLRDLRARAVRRPRPACPRRQPAELATTARADRELIVERVHASSADEWAEFLQRVYRLDTGPWLQRLIGRPGWHQYVAREAARSSLRAGCTSARRHRLARDGRPGPGRHTDDYEPDAALCASIVADGLARGARLHRRHRGALGGHGHAVVRVLRPHSASPGPTRARTGGPSDAIRRPDQPCCPGSPSFPLRGERAPLT